MKQPADSLSGETAALLIMADANVSCPLFFKLLQELNMVGRTFRRLLSLLAFSPGRDGDVGLAGGEGDGGAQTQSRGSILKCGAEPVMALRLTLQETCFYSFFSLPARLVYFLLR